MMKKESTLEGIVRVMGPDPLQGEDFDNFFAQTDPARGISPALNLAAYFRANGDCRQKVLFMGHTGSGKSTELCRFQKLVADVFEVIVLSVSDETDILDLDSADLMLAVLGRLMEHAREKNIPIHPGLLDNLVAYWKQEQLLQNIHFRTGPDREEPGGGPGFFSALRLHIKGILKTGVRSKRIIRQYMEPRLGRIISDANLLIANITDHWATRKKRPVLIIEDLDKLDIPTASRIFLKHRIHLSALNIHLVLAFPLFLRYCRRFKAIRQAFDHEEILPMICVADKKGEPWETGISVIENMVEKRIEPGLVHPHAMRYVVRQSGGALCHVFAMLQQAALFALSQKAGRLDLSHCRHAFVLLKNDFERTIDHKHLAFLEKLNNSPDGKPPWDWKLAELLQCNAVMEYGPNRWLGLHPALARILKPVSPD